MAATTLLPDTMHDALSRRMGTVILPELRKATKENFTTELVRSGYADCCSVRMTEVECIEGVRVAAVAGGKVDNVDVTRGMGVALRGNGGDGGKAFVVRKAIHGWVCVLA